MLLLRGLYAGEFEGWKFAELRARRLDRISSFEAGAQSSEEVRAGTLERGGVRDASALNPVLRAAATAVGW